MEHNDGGPAFPVLDHKIGYHADIRQKEAGISVRDYFAARAMQAIVGAAYLPDSELAVRSELQLAEQAYEFADAMIKARSQP